MVWFVVLSQYLHGETEKTARNPSYLRKISVIFEAITEHLRNIIRCAELISLRTGRNNFYNSVCAI
jgi:hypothetical protein